MSIPPVRGEGVVSEALALELVCGAICDNSNLRFYSTVCPAAMRRTLAQRCQGFSLALQIFALAVCTGDTARINQRLGRSCRSTIIASVPRV